jgi:hypothetical protein
MATVEIFDRDGKPKKNIPQYALESTLQQLVVALTNQTKKHAKTADEAKQSYSDTQKVFRDALNDNGRDMSRNLGKVSDSFGTIMKRHSTELINGIAKTTTDIASGRGFFGGILSGILGTAALTFKTFTGYMDDVRSTFSKLNEVGLNLSTGWGDNLSKSSMSVVQDFQKIGMSMAEAAVLMTNNSFALATNRRSIMNTIRAFNSLTNSGVNLGLSVQENADLILDELSARSEMLFQDQINADQEAAQVNNLITSQLRYTKALGKSIEEIRKSSQNIVKGSASSLSLIQLQGTAGAKTLTGLQALASGLVGSGFGEEFAAAMVESAAGIVPLIDESTQGYFATLGAAGVNLLPILDNLNNTTRATGLSVNKAEDFVDILTDSVVNMSDQGITNLRYMAAAGDPIAKQMLIMRASIEQAKKSLTELGRNANEQDKMFKNIRTFDRAIAEIGGLFSVMKQDLISNFSPFMEKLAEILTKVMKNEDFTKALTYFTDTIGKAIFGITGGIRDLDIDAFLATTMPKLINGIKSTADFLADAITFIKGLFPDNEDTNNLTPKVKKTGESQQEGSGLWTKFFDNIGGALTTIVESPYFKKFLVASLGIAAVTYVVGGLFNVLGTDAASKSAEFLVKLGLGIGALGLGLTQLNNVNAQSLRDIIDGVAGLMTIVGATSIAVGVTGPMGALVAAGVSVGIVATVGALGYAIQQFPFEELTAMTNGLEKISQVKTGVFSNLASEIKVLSSAIMELTSAAVGGISNNIGAFVKGDLKTPISLLADDIERLSRAAQTLPPSMTAGIGIGAIGTTATSGGAPLRSAGNSVGTPLEPITREQTILANILIELKRSVTALNELKIIEQQKLT